MTELNEVYDMNVKKKKLINIANILKFITKRSRKGFLKKVLQIFHIFKFAIKHFKQVSFIIIRKRQHILIFFAKISKLNVFN